MYYEIVIIFQYKNKLVKFCFLFLLTFLFTNVSNSSDYTNKDDHYYYDKLKENWNDIFPDGNRNAAGSKFFKYLIDQDLSYVDFIEFNKRYCPVSGSLIRPGIEPSFIALFENGSDFKTCGDVYFCCWPCACDSMKYAKSMNISHQFKGIENEFTVMVIDNPCKKNNFPLEVNREYFCDGEEINEDEVYTVDEKIVIGVIHKPSSCNSNDISSINQHPVVGGQCKVRNSTPEDELFSGMGDIFIKLSK
tara:strand:- start:191 stop:934 length:744 start_codon:yes stop_codon:yes gene_type:complete